MLIHEGRLLYTKKGSCPFGRSSVKIKEETNVFFRELPIFACNPDYVEKHHIAGS